MNEGIQDMKDMVARNNELMSRVDLTQVGDLIAKAKTIYIPDTELQCWAYAYIGMFVLFDLGFEPVLTAGTAVFITSETEPRGIFYHEDDSDMAHGWCTVGSYVVDFSVHELESSMGYISKGKQTCDHDFGSVIVQRYDTMTPLDEILHGMLDGGANAVGSVSYEMNSNGTRYVMNRFHELNFNMKTTEMFVYIMNNLSEVKTLR